MCDILVMEIPNVLRTELCAVATLIGAAVMVWEKCCISPLPGPPLPAQSSALDCDLLPCDEAGSSPSHASTKIGLSSSLGSFNAI